LPQIIASFPNCQICQGKEIIWWMLLPSHKINFWGSFHSFSQNILTIIIAILFFGMMVNNITLKNWNYYYNNKILLHILIDDNLLLLTIFISLFSLINEIIGLLRLGYHLYFGV
jgi:hypothetical protein